jgi:hypothetical protein
MHKIDKMSGKVTKDNDIPLGSLFQSLFFNKNFTNPLYGNYNSEVL